MSPFPVLGYLACLMSQKQCFRWCLVHLTKKEEALQETSEGQQVPQKWFFPCWKNSGLLPAKKKYSATNSHLEPCNFAFFISLSTKLFPVPSCATFSWGLLSVAATRELHTGPTDLDAMARSLETCLAERKENLLTSNQTLLWQWGARRLSLPVGSFICHLLSSRLTTALQRGCTSWKSLHGTTVETTAHPPEQRVLSANSSHQQPCCGWGCHEQ